MKLMRSWGSVMLGLGLLFAAFSSSSSYKLYSYTVGPGGSNSTSSTTYKAQTTVGEQANNSTSSTNYSAKNGSIQTEQINVPGAPTLSNGSNTYYDELNFIINTSSDPTDTTYSVAVSTTSGFTSTSYVQSNGTLGGSPVYQTYTAWGGGSGNFMTGLAVNTTYYVKVDAKQGLFTNTEYGAYASIATVNPSITFSVSPTSYNLGTFPTRTIETSTNLSFTFATNATSGGNVYVSGLNGGFKSTIFSYLIAAVSANLTSQTQGFGVQGTNPAQTSGGPLSVDSPYNGTGNTVGTESSTPAQIFSSANPIVGGTANANVQVKAAATAPASNDYQEVLTFVASASF
jgi:hypothetical protein